MNGLIFLSIFAVVCVKLVEGNKNYNLGSSVKIAENIEKFGVKNLNTTLVRLKKLIKTRDTIHYTFGNRVLGDKLLAYGSKSYQYPIPQYVQQEIWYPCCGSSNKYRIRFVDIYVMQSTSLGNAYIYQGGIGEYKIAIVIEAKATTCFAYDVKIYGSL